MTHDRQTGIQRELARQELARRALIPFAWYTFRAYRIAPVHRLPASYLEQVAHYVEIGGQEGIGRLMVFMPPHHTNFCHGQYCFLAKGFFSSRRRPNILRSTVCAVFEDRQTVDRMSRVLAVF